LAALVPGPAEAALALFLSAWLGLSAWRQSSHAPSHRILTWDVAGLLPVYRYFAPTPGRFDYHLLVRHEERPGSFSHWTEVDRDRPRNALNAAWNPPRRLRKARFDLLYELAREIEAAGGNVARVQLTYPYLALLLVAERELADQGAPAGTRFQFLLMTTTAHAATEPAILALSPFHRLG
jgi:hypothetical protein